MKYQGFNRIEGMHFSDGLLPADTFQTVFEIYARPVSAEIKIPYLFRDLLGECHSLI
jgi:hypothetical protein